MISKSLKIGLTIRLRREDCHEIKHKIQMVAFYHTLPLRNY